MIHEELDFEDLDKPDDQLSDKDRLRKKKIIRKLRMRIIGFTISEQKKALEDKRKELGRTLTPSEIEAVKKLHPLKRDGQSDEFEALVIINNATPRTVHHLFIDQNNYGKLFPDHFRNTHILTDKELEDRKIKLNPGESVFNAEYKMDGTWIKYTVLNRWRQQTRKVKLKTTGGTITVSIPRITTAWETDHFFFKENSVLVQFKPGTEPKIIRALKQELKVVAERFRKNSSLYQWIGEFNMQKAAKRLLKSPHVLFAKPYREKQFDIQISHVMDGYLNIEPYIETDDRGFQTVSKTKVIALYHTYTRLSDEKDLSDYRDEFRLSEGRGFIQSIMKKFQEILDGRVRRQ